MPTTPLTQQTFDRAVGTDDIVSVTFGAAGCEWTNRLVPTYEETGATPAARSGLAPGPVRYGWPGRETP